MHFLLPCRVALYDAFHRGPASCGVNAAWGDMRAFYIEHSSVFAIECDSSAVPGGAGSTVL